MIIATFVVFLIIFAVIGVLSAIQGWGTTENDLLAARHVLGLQMSRTAGAVQ